MQDPADSYSTADVARRLGVSVPTVQRWVDQGHLKAWKTVGGHRRIEGASVERFILQRDQFGTPAEVVVAVATAVSVLIVDDNPDDRDLLSALVQAALPAASVAMAENGFEALLSMGQQTPDVLVTDIVMPHMNGLEMLKHLAQMSTGPRVVMAVSSRSREQLAALGALPSGVQFVQKPLDPEIFLSTLREAALSAGLSRG